MFELKDCRGKVRLDRFAKFVSYIEFTDTCWLWQHTLTKSGYGRFRISELGISSAHRAAFYYRFGYVPGAGRNLDHLCRVRNCVRPDHLEEVTLQENLLRGEGHGKETHCPAGHPYNEEHSVKEFIPRTGTWGRRCVTCKRNRRVRNKIANGGKPYLEVPCKDRTHCPQGHVYKGDNFRVYSHKNGGLTKCCMICARARSRAKSQKRALQAG